MNREPIERKAKNRGGFTLIELLVVMIIISILLGFIFVAAMDAAHRAEERATQSLITKLEGGLNDRLEALLQTRPDYNNAHFYMGQIYNGSNPAIPGIQRAQVIAWYDYIKSEMPDVFYVKDVTATKPYPLDFASTFYPGTTTDPQGLGNYILPVGTSILNSPTTSYGDSNLSNPSLGYTGTGIYGASYTAAAGIYKNLGYLPKGYDGVDNDSSGSGQGLVDDHGEGVDSSNLALVQGNLQRHIHKTARSEMLYAILVEGRGPLGSVFSRDDFTDKEVRDTDGDGLPEFVDAWGNPLQFYRWPVLYHSDLQRGQNYSPTLAAFQPPYGSVFEEREQDPLDLNQQLMAPGWWSSASNNSFPGTLGSSSGQMSGAVTIFESFFHLLHEQWLPSTGNFWDRSAPAGKTGLTHRRAYYSKVLIVSWGQDGQPGIFGYYDELIQPAPTTAKQLIQYENPAPQFDPTADPSSSPSALTIQLQLNGQDDISNHNLQATGGIGGSG